MSMTMIGECQLQAYNPAAPRGVATKNKRRKCTYAARREQAKSLHEEIRQLESQLRVLQMRFADPAQPSILNEMMAQTWLANAQLNHSAKEQQLHVAKMQSVLPRCIGVQQSHPLYTRICLPKDWDQRRAKLVAMRDDKIRSAYNFVMDPRRLIDPAKMQFSDERFETDDGDFCGARFETVQFPGVKSLQQVYDAAVYYLTNMEISITEQLGHLTVRDDYETIDGSMYNARVLSSNKHIQMETSSLLFTKLDLDAGYGIVVLDSVDEDELYPYTPTKRIRKDVSATALFSVDKSKSDAEGEVTVTMRRAAFLKIHRPQFPLSEDALDELSGGIMAWGDVMLKTVRGIVYGCS